MMHVVTWIPFYFHWTRFFGNFDFVFFCFKTLICHGKSSWDNRKLSTITLETMSCPYNNVNDVKRKIYFLKHSVRDELQTPLYHNSLTQSNRTNVNSTINADNFPYEFHNFNVTIWWLFFIISKYFPTHKIDIVLFTFPSIFFRCWPRFACYLHVRTEFPGSADVISGHRSRVPKIILIQLHNYTHRLTSHAKILHILL